MSDGADEHNFSLFSYPASSPPPPILPPHPSPMQLARLAVVVVCFIGTSAAQHASDVCAAGDGCRSAWEMAASNGHGLCGEQISWVRNRIVGMSLWPDACSYVALQGSTPECAPCQPLVRKPREDRTDTAAYADCLQECNWLPDDHPTKCSAWVGGVLSRCDNSVITNQDFSGTAEHPYFVNGCEKECCRLGCADARSASGDDTCSSTVAYAFLTSHTLPLWEAWRRCETSRSKPMPSPRCSQA